MKKKPPEPRFPLFRSRHRPLLTSPNKPSFAKRQTFSPKDQAGHPPHPPPIYLLFPPEAPTCSVCPEVFFFDGFFPLPARFLRGKKSQRSTQKRKKRGGRRRTCPKHKACRSRSKPGPRPETNPWPPRRFFLFSPLPPLSPPENTAFSTPEPPPPAALTKTKPSSPVPRKLPESDGPPGRPRPPVSHPYCPVPPITPLFSTIHGAPASLPGNQKEKAGKFPNQQETPLRPNDRGMGSVCRPPALKAFQNDHLRRQVTKNRKNPARMEEELDDNRYGKTRTWPRKPWASSTDGALQPKEHRACPKSNMKRAIISGWRSPHRTSLWARSGQAPRQSMGPQARAKLQSPATGNIPECPYTRSSPRRSSPELEGRPLTRTGRPE